MSARSNLPGDDWLLEAPLPQQRARGLVPRGGLWLVIALFICSLFGFAIYDLAVRPAPSAAQGRSGVGGKNAAAGASEGDKLGPPPSAADVGDIAQAQVARFGAASATPPTAAASAQPAAATVAARAAAPQHQELPLPDDEAQSALNAPRARANQPGAAASEERSAEAAVSRIFASSEGAGASDGPAQQLASAIGLPRQAVDALRTGADAAGVSAAASAKPADATLDLLRGLTQATQLQTQAARASRDESWLKEAAQIKPADAAVAEEPAAAWMVFQGTRIPVVTREAVNSDLPGQLTAMASASVYDSIRQCALMIPQGTRFVGQYSSDIRAGQSRVLLAFRRMILPDGRSVQIAGAQGVDSLGQAGVAGDVDNHFLQMFGYGFAIAWIADRIRPGGSAVTVTQPNGQSTSTTVAGQVLADTASRIMNRNTAIQPTITLEVGTRMYVTVTRDIALAPTSKANCL